MSFTAPRADSFAIVLNQNNYSFNKVMYYYGTNSSFDSHIDSVTGNSTFFIFYASSAGETHYFRIAPEYAGYDKDPYGFIIRYENINYIDFLAGTGGVVSPSGRVPAPDSMHVSDTARPSSALYYFDRWETVAEISLISHVIQPIRLFLLLQWAVMPPCVLHFCQKRFIHYQMLMKILLSMYMDIPKVEYY